VHICHVIHALGAGGAEQVLVDLAQVAPAGGFTMSVVGLVTTEDAENARALTALGVPVVALGLESRWDARAFPRVLRAMSTKPPDVVHTHLKHADLVGAYAARRLGVPQVSTLHVIEDHATGLAAAKLQVAARVRHRLAARTIAVSDAQRRWYVEAFPGSADRVVTIRNGVLPPPVLTTAERSTLRSALGGDDADLLMANVSVLRPGKGHDDLLDAVAQLPDRPRFRLVLVGDGSERSRLERRVAGDDRLAPRVRFTGYRTDVPTLLGAVDLVVHPSHADALPTALIHAMAAGVPVVATAVGGIPELLGTEAGLLRPPGRADLLAEALLGLAADARRRSAMADAGRRRYAGQFAADDWARRLGSVYAELLAGRRPAARRSSG
jgi:glycosyltransferase involved in cell wall biosynthesis